MQAAPGPEAAQTGGADQVGEEGAMVRGGYKVPGGKKPRDRGLRQERTRRQGQ